MDKLPSNLDTDWRTLGWPDNLCRLLDAKHPFIDERVWSIYDANAIRNRDKPPEEQYQGKMLLELDGIDEAAYQRINKALIDSGFPSLDEAPTMLRLNDELKQAEDKLLEVKLHETRHPDVLIPDGGGQPQRGEWLPMDGGGQYFETYDEPDGGQ